MTAQNWIVQRKHNDEELMRVMTVLPDSKGHALFVLAPLTGGRHIILPQSQFLARYERVVLSAEGDDAQGRSAWYLSNFTPEQMAELLAEIEML